MSSLRIRFVQSHYFIHQKKEKGILLRSENNKHGKKKLKPILSEKKSRYKRIYISCNSILKIMETNNKLSKNCVMFLQKY